MMGKSLTKSVPKIYDSKGPREISVPISTSHSKYALSTPAPDTYHIENVRSKSPSFSIGQKLTTIDKRPIVDFTKYNPYKSNFDTLHENQKSNATIARKYNIREADLTPQPGHS